jgi:hypothetical protein
MGCAGGLFVVLCCEDPITLEIVHAHVHSTIIPILFDLWKVEEVSRNPDLVNAELNLSKDTFLKVHKLKTTNPCLKVGDVQSMVYVDGDAGPFNLTPVERVARRTSVLAGSVKKGERTKPELIAELEKEGVELPRGMNHSKIELLQQFAKDKGIALSV